MSDWHLAVYAVILLSIAVLMCVFRMFEIVEDNKSLKRRLEEAELPAEPCVEGECCWRYPGGKSKCNRPYGHDGEQGKTSCRLPGFILAPHPNTRQHACHQ